jgi:hypothetical protein
MITLLVVAGIALLIAIGYMNHVVENNKLERARTKIELNDRLRRCGEITETFPGQFMTPALKLLLTRLELNVCQRLLNLEKPAPISRPGSPNWRHWWPRANRYRSTTRRHRS